MRYGGIVAVGQYFWFLQTQADIVIAGRLFDPHDLGVYTTALFLVQMFVSKFVPPTTRVPAAARWGCDCQAPPAILQGPRGVEVQGLIL
jgi:hypothetical protein